MIGIYFSMCGSGYGGVLQNNTNLKSRSKGRTIFCYVWQPTMYSVPESAKQYLKCLFI